VSGKISGKPIFGIGINTGEFPASLGNKPTKEYNLWTKMLRRCGDDFLLTRPTYEGVTCSENFKSYSFFYDWCQTQVGFGNKDKNDRFWHLDKDILVKGNKLYSEDTCVFVPHRINSLLLRCNTKRGEYPVGVSKGIGKWNLRVYCRDGAGNHKHLGYFNNLLEAFKTYKEFKEDLIKRVAEEYKNQLDPRAYQALIKYEVEITD